MSLIEEIEAAAVVFPMQDLGAARQLRNDAGSVAYWLTDSPWWQRIKAALEAAQEMSDSITGRDHYMPTSIDASHNAQRKFREAMK